MAEDYRNQAIGVFELESECICFVALDAAAKAAALDVARPLTKIVSHTVIASPSEDTEKAIAMTINK